MRLSSFALLGAATALFVGCDLLTDPADRIDVMVTLSSDLLARETDTLTIQVRAYNPTADTVRFDGGGCLLQFEIRNDASEVVAPDLLACPAILRHVRLAPGDSLTADFRWYGERWTSRVSPPPPELLPVGLYRVYGLLDAIGDQQRSEPREVELAIPTRR